MRDIDELDAETLGRIDVVLSDIDDTITSEGRLTAAAYLALERLHDAGIKVIPITGRPAGWCDHIARMWPVDGVVGENGAFTFVYDRARRTMRQRFWADPDTMARNRRALDDLAKVILTEVPGCALASDQPYRVADLAIDFCEDVPALPESQVDRIVSLFHEHGAQAKVSSIHVNGWFGDYDKLSMARIMLHDELGLTLEGAGERMMFVGDSPNDEPMFRAFPLSFGVANVRASAHRLAAKPRYVTRGRSGEGFAELADRILAARGSRHGD
jgi:HAD superfamily hydrolase (TIGR01484 family)